MIRRIGKDIRVKWRILTNGKELPLHGRDLRLEVVNRFGRKEWEFTIEDENVVVFTLPGRLQRYLGEYTFTLWENFGKAGQTAVDSCGGIELVPTTCMEGGDSGPDTEPVELETASLELGVSGASAYETWLAEGHEGTEEDFLAWLCQPATDAADNALDAAEAATDAAAKAETATAEMQELYDSSLAAENERQEAELGRISAEAARQEAEQGRNTAELTRRLAETERKAAESLREQSEKSRSDAEAERNAAEILREQNTSTAIQEAVSATDAAEAATEEMEQLYGVALAAESERQTAEQERVKAEQERAAEFARLKEESEAATRAANEAAESAEQAAESGGSVATTGLLQLLLEHPDEPYTLTEEEVQSVFGGIENFRKAVAGSLALRDVFSLDGESVTMMLQPIYTASMDDVIAGFWVIDEQMIKVGLKSNYITIAEQFGAVNITYVNGTGPDGGLFYELPGSIYSITDESTPEELEAILGDFAELKSAIRGPGKKLIVSAGYHTTDNFGGASSRDYAPIVVEAEFFFGGNTNPTYSILFKTPDQNISIRLASSSGGYTSAKVDTLSTASKSVVGAINELKEDIDDAEEKISGKQDRTDQSLKTTDKTVAGAINEINSKLPVYTTVPELTTGYTIPDNPTNVEHIYYITIGDTVYNVTGADGIKWVDGIAPVAAANTTLVVSVINNLAVWGGF